MTSMRRQNNIRRHINHVINRLTINLSHISRKIAPRHVAVRQSFFTKTTVDAAKEFFSGCCFGKRGDPQQFAYVFRHLLISVICLDGTGRQKRATPETLRFRGDDCANNSFKVQQITEQFFVLIKTLGIWSLLSQYQARHELYREQYQP